MKNCLIHLLPCALFAIASATCFQFKLDVIGGALALITVAWFFMVPTYLE